MANNKKQVQWHGVFVGVLVCCLVVACRGAVYMVGDSSGWDISTDVDSWVTGKKFVVGDVLMFQYSSYHSVCQLTKEEFQGCNTSKAVLSTSGNSTFPLSKPGNMYFSCGNRLHCLGGMKLQVQVHPNSTAGSGSSPIGSPEQAPPPPSTSSQHLPNTSKTNYPTFSSSAHLHQHFLPYYYYAFLFLVSISTLFMGSSISIICLF